MERLSWPAVLDFPRRLVNFYFPNTYSIMRTKPSFKGIDWSDMEELAREFVGKNFLIKDTEEVVLNKWELTVMLVDFLKHLAKD